MQLTRKHGTFFLGVALWNVVTWLMFAKNLYGAYAAGEERDQGYWIAHSVLIVVNLVLGGVFAWFGVKAFRSRA